MSREFASALSEFQVVQRRAIEKERANKAALEESQPGQSPSGDRQQQTQLLEEPQLAQQEEVDFQENLIIEREGEIRQIEQSVGELNELFRDVAHIVREQGDVLDVIDVNVGNTLDDTRGADVELRSASRYQKSCTKQSLLLAAHPGYCLDHRDPSSSLGLRVIERKLSLSVCCPWLSDVWRGVLPPSVMMICSSHLE